MLTKYVRAILKTFHKSEKVAVLFYSKKSFMIFIDKRFNNQWYKSTSYHKEDESKIYGVAPRGNKISIYYVTLESKRM